jgi:hypothetical protein
MTIRPGVHEKQSEPFRYPISDVNVRILKAIKDKLKVNESMSFERGRALECPTRLNESLQMP